MVDVNNQPPADDPILDRFVDQIGAIEAAAAEEISGLGSNEPVGPLHVLRGSTSAFHDKVTFLVLHSSGVHSVTGTVDANGKLQQLEGRWIDKDVHDRRDHGLQSL